MKSGKVLLGVLAGVAAGALIGILIAPDKGSKTRRKIAAKTTDYTNGLKTTVDGVLNIISEKYKNIKQEAARILSDGEAKYNENQEVVR